MKKAILVVDIKEQVGDQQFTFRAGNPIEVDTEESVAWDEITGIGFDIKKEEYDSGN